MILIFLVVAYISARSIGYTNTTNVIISYWVYIVITRNDKSNEKLVSLYISVRYCYYIKLFKSK